MADTGGTAVRLRELWPGDSDEDIVPLRSTESSVEHQASGSTGQRQAEPMYAMIAMGDNAGSYASVQFTAVCRTDTREVLPRREGTIQDGTVVDQYDDPELMTDFAEQYLSAYRAVMPSGRPPNSVVEMMPALHLVVMAVELVMKAELTRSEKDPGNVHSLERLYKALDGAHRQEAESSFARCEPNTRLQSVGETPPTITDMLKVYDLSYGRASKVYMDTRYYAEPIDEVREIDGSAWRQSPKE